MFLATCPRCGPVPLEPERISLTTYRADRHPAAARSRYRFACPACGRVVDTAAPAETVRRLVLSGVEEQTAWCSMAELVSGSFIRPQHPELPPGGPPRTRDDLLDFVELMNRPDWFERLSSPSR